MSEPFFILGLVAVFWIVVPTLILWFVGLFEGFPRLRLKQLAGLTAYVAWTCAMFVARGAEKSSLAVVTTAVVALVFAGVWKREFQIFMRMSDEDFPAKHGWVLWAIMLTILAPFGVWAFRAHRRALEANARLRKAIREPWLDLETTSARH